SAERVLVEYRNASLDPLPDASARTDLTRKFDPQCSLLGIQYQGGFQPGVIYDYTVNDSVLDDPWFAGTGFTRGATAPVVGYEWDGLWKQCAIKNQTVLFSWDGPKWRADAVRYVASSGAKVFAAGDMLFAQALDGWRPRIGGGTNVGVDPRLQRFTLNMLRDLERCDADAARLPARRRPARVQMGRREPDDGARRLVELRPVHVELLQRLPRDELFAVRPVLVGADPEVVAPARQRHARDRAADVVLARLDQRLTAGVEQEDRRRGAL